MTSQLDRHIADPSAVIADLDAWWAASPKDWYKGDPLTALRQTSHDQVSMTDNPYWEIVRRLPMDRLNSWETAVESYVMRGRSDYMMSRGRLVKSFAWSIPSPSDLSWIAGMVSAHPGIVEIGAGTGYWAGQLSQFGVDVVSYDAEPGGNKYCAEVQYHPVLLGGPDAGAPHSDRALFLCWPPYDEPMAAEALKAYGGDLLIYAGESEYGCTGDEEFFRMLGAEWTELGESPRHVTFGGIHCHLTAYKRGGGS